MINIQLFSDGGAFTRHKISISTGLMFVDKKKILSYNKINFNKDSDFAELFAINKLLSRAYGHCKQKDILNDDYMISVYTDSLTSITSILSEKENLLTNERRTQLIYEIRETICKFDNKVKFYHIKSHISGKHLKTSHKMFCKENNVEIPFSEFLFIQQQNKNCDNTVAKEFKKYNKQKKIEEAAFLKLQKMNQELDDIIY